MAETESTSSAQPQIAKVTSRPLTPAEAVPLDFFAELEGKSIANLEAAAREILKLTTGFLGLLLGIVSLGSDSVAPILQVDEIKYTALAAILLLVLALASALLVVLPRGYQYRPSSLDDKEAAFQLMLDRKSASLSAAVIFFGLSLASFAGLIILIFALR